MEDLIIKANLNRNSKMSKGYTKQQVEEWKGSVEKRKETNKKKTFKVSFSDLIEAESEDQCLVKLKEYFAAIKEEGSQLDFEFEEFDLEKSGEIRIIFAGNEE